MTNNVEVVTIRVNGKEYAAWPEVSVSAKLKGVREFTMQTTERPSEWSFLPGTPVEILANDDVVLTGFFNRYNPSIQPEHHPITCYGRGKAQDIYDSHADTKTGRHVGKKPSEILKAENYTQANVITEVAEEAKPHFQVRQGETLWNMAKRAVNDQGLVMTETAKGDLSIMKARSRRHAGSIQEGRNLIDGNSDITDDQRHSETKVKGQNRDGTDDETALRIEKTATDSSVKRARKKVIVNQDNTTPASAQKRADKNVEWAQGMSVKATLVVQGWRDDGGRIWEPGDLIYVSSLSLKLDGDMTIESAEMKQNAEGESISTLQVVDPKAYGGKGGKSGSDPAYTAT